MADRKEKHVLFCALITPPSLPTRPQIVLELFIVNFLLIFETLTDLTGLSLPSSAIAPPLVTIMVLLKKASPSLNQDVLCLTVYLPSIV